MDVELRPATTEDLLWIESAVRSCPVAMAEFGGFYGRATTVLPPLLGEQREVLMICSGEHRVGFVDADHNPEDSTVGLAYFVAPEVRRRGHALAALEKLTTSRPGMTFSVAIGAANAPSLALARRAGFVDAGVNEWGDLQLTRRGAVAAPHPQTVVGAVIVADGHVLAARRIRPRELAGQWEFPGGKVEPGEELRAALVREVHEELGVEITIVDEIGGDEPVWPISPGLELRLYLASLVSGEPCASVDHDQLRWLHPAELDTVDWLPPDEDALDAVRRALRQSDAKRRSR